MQAIRPVYLPRTVRSQTNRKLQYTLWFSLIVASIIGSFLLVKPEILFTPDDYLTLGTFGAIGVWSLAALYLTMYERPYCLNTTHWVFILFFYSYAPLVQFLTQNFPGQADVGAFGSLHLKTNGLILLWCLCYSLTYHYVTVKRSKQPSAPPVTDAAKPNYAWLILFCLACTALAFATTGASHLFSRVVDSDVAADPTEGMSSPVALIVGTISRACPVGAMVILLVTGPRKQIWYYAAFVTLAACALMTNFPIAITRFLSGSITISYVCVLLSRKRLTGLWLLLLFWLAFIIAMPFLNLFRNNTFKDADVGSYKQQDLTSIVTGGDFDAYMMTLATVSYGQKPDNITMGRQLIGNLLFFVPRQMWPDKPEGSGALVVQNTVLDFYNLSEPLPAEGYVNFGALGVALFAIVFAWILAALDKKYWAEMAGSLYRRPNLVTITYPLLIGLVVFIMRGTLLSTFAYTMGMVIACWVALKIAYLGSQIKNAAQKQSPAARARYPLASSFPLSRFFAGPRD